MYVSVDSLIRIEKVSTLLYFIIIAYYILL